MSLHDESTEQSRFEDLARQYANLQAMPEGPARDEFIIFCPWCLKTNKPGAPSCCFFFGEGIAKIGQSQLQSLIDQRREVRLGAKRSIKCPYCGAYNREAEEDPANWVRPLVSPFCCELMDQAVIAIGQREVLKQSIENAKRVEDNIVKA